MTHDELVDKRAKEVEGKCKERDHLREVLENWKAPDSMRIPLYMHDAIIAWAVDYIRPGGFLMAVLQNNLVQAVNLSDQDNASALRSYATFVYNELPSECWGSSEQCESWIGKGIKEYKQTDLEDKQIAQDTLKERKGLK